MERKGTFRFTVDIPVDIHTQLRTLSALRAMSMREIVLEGIKKQLKQLKLDDVERVFKDEKRA